MIAAGGGRRATTGGGLCSNFSRVRTFGDVTSGFAVVDSGFAVLGLITWFGFGVTVGASLAVPGVSFGVVLLPVPGGVMCVVTGGFTPIAVPGRTVLDPNGAVGNFTLLGGGRRCGVGASRFERTGAAGVNTAWRTPGVMWR